MKTFASIAAAFVAAGCAAAPPPSEPAAKPAPSAAPRAEPPPPSIPPLEDEAHFKTLRRLTFGGENAEAYWSFSGRELVLQSKRDGAKCDRIYRMDLAEPNPALVPVSDGKGAT